MKILFFSDLHNEFAIFYPPEIDYDLVVLAGDIDIGALGISWAKNFLEEKPVIYIAGNHEYYGRNYFKTLNKLKDKSEESNVHYLENKSVIIDDVRFLGSTLWTDFNLFGAQNRDAAKESALREMNDYKVIEVAPFQYITPDKTIELHFTALAWLRDELAKPHSGKTVVVTHHSPSALSIHSRFEGDILNAAYASNLDKLVEESGAELWIHGHTHHNVDYKIGNTRVVSNQRGYVPKERNRAFLEDWLIEL